MTEVMSKLKKQCRTRGFIQALLLALLLNLSGHMFLHLSDLAADAGAPHFASHEEPSNTAAPQHQCSVCQDHQQLVLDVPAASFSPAESRLGVVTTTAASVYDFQIFSLARSRAPPRN